MELISRVAYCTREDVKRALDFQETARVNEQVDRAIVNAAENIEGFMHRRFFPEDSTKYFDWPNYQYAYPWRLWFDQYDLVTATSVTSGGQAIPLDNIFFEPVNKEPEEPFTYLELNRSSNGAFGVGNTPQHDIAITGTWGYTAASVMIGRLGADITDPGATTALVSDASRVGVGDLIIIGTERLLVQERSTATTGQTNLTGATTAQANDVTITVTDGTAVSAGEVLQIDSERLLVTDITGGTLTVKRAWDGSVLAAHGTGTTLYAYRNLTVARGQYGTTATTHSMSAAVNRHRVPAMIRNLALAESLNSVLQEQSGYARVVGGGETAIAAPGFALSEAWDEARTRYARKSRSGVI